jgi:hypothetical protein
VYWHTYALAYAHPKRTWINKKSLGLAPTEKPAPVHGLLYVDEAGNYSGPFVGK